MEDDLYVTRSCVIAGNELHFRATASGGAGGQHVNTTNSRVELTFSVEKSRSLGPRQKARIVAKIGSNIRVVASDRRSQFQNRHLARQRLATKLEQALQVEKLRKQTRKTKGSIETRLKTKRHRSTIKNDRRRPTDDD